MKFTSNESKEIESFVQGKYGKPREYNLKNMVHHSIAQLSYDTVINVADRNYTAHCRCRIYCLKPVGKQGGNPSCEFNPEMKLYSQTWNEKI